MSRVIAIVMAAGKGTRMESEKPKVLVEACGRPLIEYVMDALDQAGVDESVVVVGYRADQVRQALAHRSNVRYALQQPQLGTGHAVQVCRPLIAEHDGPVVVLTGDSPMVQSSSLQALLDDFAASRPACLLGTLEKEDPTGLGRIIRDEEGEFLAIVEQKDADAQQRQVREVNMSTYVFDCQPLLRSLDQLTNDNRQGEYYITDCPGLLRAAGAKVRALPVLQECESLSVNNLADLALVERALQNAQRVASSTTGDS